MIRAPPARLRPCKAIRTLRRPCRRGIIFPFSGFFSRSFCSWLTKKSSVSCVTRLVNSGSSTKISFTRPYPVRVGTWPGQLQFQNGESNACVLERDDQFRHHREARRHLRAPRTREHEAAPHQRNRAIGAAGRAGLLSARWSAPKISPHPARSSPDRALYGASSRFSKARRRSSFFQKLSAVLL